MAYDDIYKVLVTRSFAVATAGGAVASTAVFGPQTYAVDLIFPGAATTSTAGCRFAIGLTTDQVSSTQGGLIPCNWLARYKVSPGQSLSAISNDAVAGTLTVMELTK